MEIPPEILFQRVIHIVILLFRNISALIKNPAVRSKAVGCLRTFSSEAGPKVFLLQFISLGVVNPLVHSDTL